MITPETLFMPFTIKAAIQITISQSFTPEYQTIIRSSTYKSNTYLYLWSYTRDNSRIEINLTL